jgi:transcriptional regulator with XRE-family HTH domain
VPTKTATSSDDTMGIRARHSRKKAQLSLIEAAYRIRAVLPESEWRSYQAIHRIETGEVNEEDASPAFLAALAKVYDVPLEDLSPLAAHSRQRLLTLFMDGEPDQGFKSTESSTLRNRKGPGRTGGLRPGGREHPGMERAAG